MGRWVLHTRAARRTVWPACGLCLLVLAAGCPKKKAPDYAEVSGTVFYKDKPLPGGQITFVSEQGAFPGSGTIDENGKYKVSAPIGDVKISVDNAMMQPPSAAGRRGPAPPSKMPGLKRPDSETAHKMAGHFVAIPQKYYNPQESGLTYKVVPGAQTHDIKLE
jgi:hypothetical protein